MADENQTLTVREMQRREHAAKQRERDFRELLQAHAAGLIEQDEARKALERMRPEWVADG